MYLDSVCQQRKRDAILNQTLPMETIQLQTKGANKLGSWRKATKMAQKLHMWAVFDGDCTKEVSTVDLEENWEIDLQYNLFPNNKALKKKRYDSDVRRRQEKDVIIKQLAHIVAEEERDAEMKRIYETFMEKSDKSFTSFNADVVSTIIV